MAGRNHDLNASKCQADLTGQREHEAKFRYLKHRKLRSPFIDVFAVIIELNESPAKAAGSFGVRSLDTLSAPKRSAVSISKRAQSIKIFVITSGDTTFSALKQRSLIALMRPAGPAASRMTCV